MRRTHGPNLPPVARRARAHDLGPGGGGDGADGGDGAGHDQRARARQHEDQQGVVQRLGPGLVHRERGHEEAEGRHPQQHRRVRPREAVHDLRQARHLRLGVLDQLLRERATRWGCEGEEAEAFAPAFGRGQAPPPVFVEEVDLQPPSVTLPPLSVTVQLPAVTVVACPLGAIQLFVPD